MTPVSSNLPSFICMVGLVEYALCALELAPFLLFLDTIRFNLVSIPVLLTSLVDGLAKFI